MRPLTLRPFLALTALGLVVASIDPALAGGTVSSSVSNVGKNISEVPILVNYGSYIIGVALAVTGLGRLKAHFENPAQTPMRDPLGRLGVAAMFISLPSVLKMLMKTGSLEGSAASYQKISALSS